MSEIVRREQPYTAVAQQSTPIELWAADLTLAFEAARKLVVTSFVPASFKGKPEEAAAAIMTGAEVGLTPLASLRSINVIQGTPAFTAIAMRALAQSHGHDMWVVESTKTRAIVQGQRAGADRVEESVWTTDRARDLGLLGKSNWKQQPIAMLIARATSECARLVAADVLLGIPYSAEELEDGLAEVGVESVKPVRASRKVQRRPLPASVEPDLDEPMVLASAPVEGPSELVGVRGAAEGEKAPGGPVTRGNPTGPDGDDAWLEAERAEHAAWMAERDGEES